MDTQKLFTERIISGFIHLIWLSITIFILLGITPIQFAAYLKDINGGLAALLVSIIVGASFLFGNLFDRIITDQVKVWSGRYGITPKPISEIIDLPKVSSEDILDLRNTYTDKAFFRSVGSAGIAIVLVSLLWNGLNGSYTNTYLCILIIGLFLEVAIWRIVLVLKKKYSKLFDKIKSINAA
jgi:hypothetical protein